MNNYYDRIRDIYTSMESNLEVIDRNESSWSYYEEVYSQLETAVQVGKDLQFDILRSSNEQLSDLYNFIDDIINIFVKIKEANYENWNDYESITSDLKYVLEGSANYDNK